MKHTQLLPRQKSKLVACRAASEIISVILHGCERKYGQKQQNGHKRAHAPINPVGFAHFPPCYLSLCIFELVGHIEQYIHWFVWLRFTLMVRYSSPPCYLPSQLIRHDGGSDYSALIEGVGSQRKWIMWSWSLWLMTSLLCSPKAAWHVGGLPHITLSNEFLHLSWWAKR